VTRGILLFGLFASKMSDSEEFVSFSETEDSRDVLEDSDADELVEPYQDEPRAHSSDEEEDYEVDEDGLSPAVLRARFEGDSRLEEW